MLDLLAQLKRYLRDTLDVALAITPWEGGRRVPVFLQDRYQFFSTQLIGLPCLLMVDRNEHEEPPATIRKHIDQVQTKWDESVFYVRERITGYNRKRLVEHKIPFIVPGNQMYLPMIGIDFRERFRKLRPEKRGLSPSSQAVLIHALLQNVKDLNPTNLATKLGYSVMTMSRALDALEAAEIGESKSAGRERYLSLEESKREIWQKALPLLRSPVKNRHAIQMVRDQALGPQSGMVALAHYSMMAEPENVTVALSRTEWKSLQQRDVVTTIMADEPNGMVVEVWSYPPTLFADAGWVDRLSLYLSLQDMNDERVQIALEQTIEAVPW